MAKSNKKICVIGGHGKQVKGKCSPKITDMDIPDEFIEGGRFREWKYNRIIAEKVQKELVSKGYDARLLVPEDDDVSLYARARRVNDLCTKYGAGNVLLIEIHANAFGNGDQFTTANGWEAYTTRGKTKSDSFAECLYKSAMKNMPNKKMRTDTTDGDLDKESNFYLIKTVKCPAVLTENFFYTNKDDLLYMTSEEGVDAVVKTHVEGIIDYIEP